MKKCLLAQLFSRADRALAQQVVLLAKRGEPLAQRLNDVLAAEALH